MERSRCLLNITLNEITVATMLVVRVRRYRTDGGKLHTYVETLAAFAMEKGEKRDKEEFFLSNNCEFNDLLRDKARGYTGGSKYLTLDKSKS